MRDLYVVNCCRTAIGSFGGALKNTPAVDLGAIVIKEALNRAGVKPEQVDEVMFGCILTAAQGQNVARQASIKAGIPYSVPAYTVGMVCGSGMKSMIEGARSILAGDADVVVCGGTENMSAAPYAVPTGRYGARMGHTQMIDTMIKDGLWDAYNNYHMGTTAENIADIWGITRKEMDEFAASSQQKTEAAQKAGKFEAEIVPVPVKVKKDIVEFKVDEFPRAGVTAASAWHRGGVCPQLEILQKGVDLLPVTRYNVARNKEVMGCHPKAGPSISKIVGLNSSLLLWKSNAKKWRRSSGSYKKDRNPKRNGSTKRLMKNSANKNPPRCSSLATGRHGGCTPNTQGLFYPLEAG